jgi:RNA polymerase sigma-70 factor (ECF subfamily)
MLNWIYEQLRLLPPVDRALMLLHLDGVSYREMAGILGLSESNVGAKLNRIKSKLAKAAKGE